MYAHPKFHEVAGVCKRFPESTRVLFQAFLDLKYHMKYEAVDASVLRGIDVPVVMAQKTGSAPRELFVPVAADGATSIAHLDDILAASCADKVHLAVIDSDSTVTYYNIATFPM
ncbi:hypothetical protein GGF46_005345 [Coemansia sp. RSA 552]|nr:hypothetical protein GGF46_005345 [Coemansia sp. RSA 552]